MILTRVWTLFLLGASFFDLAVSFAIRKNTANDTIRTVYQFAEGTWIENLAVRPNGQLLLTFLEEPILVLLDPSGTQEPVLVYRFPNATSLTGIAEISPDVFAVAVGNFSFTTGATSGSWSVWTVDMSDMTTHNTTAEPKITKITDIPSAVFLNGMSNMPGDEDLFLVGDIRAGVVFGVDLTTQTSQVLISNNLTAAGSNAVFGTAGIDGLHVRDGFIFFTNVAQAAFMKMPINAQGRVIGNGTVIAKPINPEFDYFDDFTFDSEGNAYLVTGSGNSVEEISVDGEQRLVAGSLNSTVMAEPTAVHFGRRISDRGTLYVVTAGGLATPVDGNLTVGAQVLAVEPSFWRK